MRIKKGLFITALFVLLSSAAFSQSDTGNQAATDENFRLNITSKQITENNYESKVEVAVESETKPAVELKVGAGVQAQKITLRLINITGDVRFRGSLEKILERIKLRRPPEDN